MFKLRDIHQRVAREGIYRKNYLEEFRPPVIGEFLFGREESVPEITTLEAAVVYLQDWIGDKAKHCSGPTCPAPYFIATKKWQKFCSPQCAEPAQRECKRQWWRENRAKDRGPQ